MHTTTALLLNALLDLAAIGGLAAVVRAGLRLRGAESGDLRHLSQPLPRSLYAYERQPSLSRAA